MGELGLPFLKPLGSGIALNLDDNDGEDDDAHAEADAWFYSTVTVMRSDITGGLWGMWA